MSSRIVRARIGGKWRTCQYISKSGRWVTLRVQQQDLEKGMEPVQTILITQLRKSDQANFFIV